jgi:Cu-processing system ATP-binding protein
VSAPALELHGISRRYRAGIAGCSAQVSALSGVSLTVAPGERVAVVGSAGAGKTTLLLCAAGILTPDRGAVRAARAAYVAGHGSAHPYVSVRASLEFASTMHELDGRDDTPDVQAVLLRTGLSGVAHIRVGALDAGMRARAAVAHALLQAPGLLCLDEPLASVGAYERREYGALLQLLAGDGIATLVTARDARQVADVADRVVALECGQLLQSCDRRTLELDVGMPGFAANALAGRIPSVRCRGRALRVSLDRISAEEVRSACQSLGIDVRGSRVLSARAPASGRVAEGGDGIG